MTCAAKINSRIREKGMKQRDIAASLGIKQSTLSLKINNKRPFDLDEAFQMAQLLEIPSDEFSSYFFCT